MMRQYSLAHLTVIGASPPRLVELAGQAGYDFVGLRLRDVLPGDGWPMASGSAMMRDTLRALEDHSVHVLDVELARLTPEAEVADFRPMLEAAAALGARHVLAQGHDDDQARLDDRFAALADLAGTYGLGVGVEFLTWTPMRGMAEALALIERSGRDNVGLVIDTLHFCRSGCDPALIDRVAPSLLPFIQLADASAETPGSVEGLVHTARNDRLMPGDGGLDLLPILKRIPPETIIAVEIPNTRLAREMSDEARVKLALDKARALVARAG